MRSLIGPGLLLLVMAIACGEDDRPGVSFPTGGSGGRKNTAGNGSGNSDRGGEGGAAEAGAGGAGGATDEPVDARAPLVIIQSPEAASDVSTGDILLDSEIAVVCSVTQSDTEGSAPPDPASVKIALLDADGAVVEEVDGVPTDNRDEYSATVYATDIPNGVLSVRCSAEDTSNPPLIGSDQNDTFIDHGPSIDVINPLADSAHPLFGALNFEFDVLEAPLSEDDTEADVEEVTLEVNGKNIVVDEPSPGSFLANIDFTDTAVFPDTPQGTVPVVITATNARSVKRSVGYNFLLDGDGPEIEITSHKSNQVIGDEVNLEFTVTDALSGVNANSVVVQLNTAEYPFEAGPKWSLDGDKFTFTFDQQEVKNSKVQLTVLIRASDAVGNVSQGSSMSLWLDYQPPYVDLDPAQMRALKRVPSPDQCSNAFDPVGPSAVNDLQPDLAGIAIFRSFVWEETNFIPEANADRHYAGIAEDKVKIYIQPLGSAPLLVEAGDGDDDCDDVDLTLNFRDLQGVTPAGGAIFGTQAAGEPLIDGVCEMANGSDSGTFLCGNDSDMTFVIKHTDLNDSAIFGLPELTGPTCTGSSFEFASFMVDSENNPIEGWFCVAGRAEDLVGNVGVSRPLRLCYDNPDTVSVPPCVTGDEPPPTCTDGCVAPDRFGSVFYVVD